MTEHNTTSMMKGTKMT